MQVRTADNQPAFGIKYVDKNLWNPKILEAFEKSNLLKEIDAKYPQAEVRYYKRSMTDSSVRKPKNIYTTILDIILEPYKNYRWNIASYQEYIPDKFLMESLQKLSLKTVEKESVRELTPVLISEKAEIKKPNLFQRLFSKLFADKQ